MSKKVIIEINKIIDDSNRLYLNGTKQVTELPEFAQSDMARDFINVLDEKDLVANVLNAGDAEDINVYIGSENENDELKNFSIVTFNHLLEGQDLGTIGIIGPKRMDYSKVISVMKYISKRINDNYKKSNKEDKKSKKDKQN